MKSINKIKSIVQGGLMLCMAAGMYSCDLNEFNPSGATSDAVWSTPEGIETGVNGAYSNLRAQFYGREDIMYFSESGTDLWFNAKRQNYLNQIARYEALTPSLGQAKNTWERLYAPISNCNAIIERIGNITYTDQTLKKKREGEVRFLRAYYYWHIVETFGGVHLLTQEVKEPILKIYRSSEADFYKLMIEDLKIAVNYLQVETTEAENGRATKKAAMGLLARVYLTWASHLQYDQKNTTEAQTYYALARDAAKAVIDGQATLGTSLYSNFADVFNPNNNKKNKEALFVVSHTSNQALEANTNWNRLHMWYLIPYSGRPGLIRTIDYGRDNSGMLMPTKFLLNLFNEDIDGRYAASFQEVWLRNNSAANQTWSALYVNQFKKPSTWVGQPIAFGMGDTALYVTKKKLTNKAERRYACLDIDDIYDVNTDSIMNGEQRYYYPSLKKFMDPLTRGTDPNVQAGAMNVIVMRLAEMYLIAAEAEMHLGKNDLAASYINVLRTRAAVKTPVDKTAAMQVSASDINLDFILNERARELCGEHLRWFDLKRTRQLENRLGLGKANPDLRLFNKNIHYLRPVPQTFLDALLNREEFGQNPGY